MALYLVDGHALAYRSYYAFVRRPLMSSKGEETSAVFGFLKTLLNLLEKFEPSHVAVVFDSTEATFRSELFSGYKANRPGMPESLAAQLPRIFEILDAMSIESIAQDGFEADDVIATIARKFEANVPIRLVSGDKDLYQLVSEGIHLIRPGKNGLLDEEVDPAYMLEDLGLTPEQFVDYQALMGDPTDNVPGVRGIGDKTALRLIQKYGSLESLYEHVDEVSQKALREKLIKGKDSAFMSRKLVRLEDHVPLEVSLDSFERREPNRDKLIPLLRELEFGQMLEAIQAVTVAAPTEVEINYGLVDSEASLQALVERLGSCDEFAIDVESSAVDAMRAVLAGISVATSDGTAWYVPVKSVIDEAQALLVPAREAPGLPLDAVRRRLGPVLADPARRKVGQNVKYDAVVLANAGMPLGGVYFDTMLASYCLYPSRRSHGLDSLAEEVLGHRMIPYKSLFDPRDRRKDIRTVPLAKIVEYACEDADFTLRLKKYFAPLLEASQVHGLFYDVEMPLCAVLTRMELTGVALDVSFLGRLSSDLAARLVELEEQIYREAGERFNINSTARLQHILFKKLGLEPSHKTKTGFSTDIDVLKSLSPQHPLPNLVIEYRTVAKLKGTYIDALPKLVHPRTGRVHTSFNQAVTITGRLSSSDPNLQNIPIRTPLGREIRKAFVARGSDWVLLDADYSQIELRIMAHLSQDADLVAAFEEDADVHRRTAAKILDIRPEEVTDDMRARAKTVNFGIIYGMGARGLAQSLGIEVSEAKQFIDDYFARYPGVRRFIDETIASARRDKAVSTLLGRVRQLPDIQGTDGRGRAFSERTAVNTPIQGTAADIIKVAMVEIDRRLRERGLKAEMILQVHDELVFEVPREELDEVQGLVRDAMEGALPLSVPLKVDMGVGSDWLEAHN